MAMKVTCPKCGHWFPGEHDTQGRPRRSIRSVVALAVAGLLVVFGGVFVMATHADRGLP